MKSLHKSVLIWYSPQQMFDVVTDVARYHEFLPGCHQSAVVERTSEGMLASIGMKLAGFTQSFTTRNEHLLQSDGARQVRMTLHDGPFRHLEGVWSFDPIVGSPTPACKVKLDLNYEIKNTLLQMAIGGAFDKLAASLVDAFVERAKKIYA